MVIGLTGSFGTGKSTVARLFKEKRVYIIDADRINHQILKNNKPVIKKIVNLFGGEILSANSSINRKKLGRKVFGNKKDLSRLTRITHQVIISKIKDKIKKIRKRCKCPIIIIDAPLLFEAGLQDLADILIVVKTDKEKLIRRLQKRGFTKCEILKRAKLQMPLGYKLKQADYVINNNGSIDKTKGRVNKIIEEIKNFY